MLTKQQKHDYFYKRLISYVLRLTTYDFYLKNKHMKTIIKLGILFTFIISSISPISSNAQNCSKKKFCDEDVYGKFDYRSQSSYAILAAGDTARASIVIYSKQDARILVCFDPLLGDVNWRIYEPVRYTKRTIKNIYKNEDEIAIYEKDEYGDPVQEIDEWGDPVYDENYDPVYKIERYETSVEVDTVWQTEKINTEKIIFDHSKSGKPYWQRKNVPKTKRLLIEVIIPESDDDYEGCVNVEVGHKSASKKKTFHKLDK